MKLSFEIELLHEAVEFLENLDSKTREKIYYNLKKSQFVDDNELFEKLNESIWEFRTLYNGKAYRLFAFLGQSKWERHVSCSDSWNLEKDSKDTSKRNKKG
jgi:hypothetical protein